MRVRLEIDGWVKDIDTPNVNIRNATIHYEYIKHSVPEIARGSREPTMNNPNVTTVTFAYSNNIIDGLPVFKPSRF